MDIAQLPYDLEMKRLDPKTHCFSDGKTVPFQRVPATPPRLTWQSRPDEEEQRWQRRRSEAYGCTPTSQMDYVLSGATQVAKPAVLQTAIHEEKMVIRWQCALTGRASRIKIETGDIFPFYLNIPPYTRKNETLTILKIYKRSCRLSVYLRNRGRPFDMSLVQFLTFVKMVEEEYFLIGSDTFLYDVRGNEVNKLGYPILPLKGWPISRMFFFFHFSVGSAPVLSEML